MKVIISLYKSSVPEKKLFTSFEIPCTQVFTEEDDNIVYIQPSSKTAAAKLQNHCRDLKILSWQSSSYKGLIGIYHDTLYMTAQTVSSKFYLPILPDLNPNSDV